MSHVCRIMATFKRIVMNLKVKCKYNFVVLLNMSSIPLKKNSPNKKKISTFTLECHYI